MNNKVSLIIPKCTDLNRGDQALVLETLRIIRDTYNSNEIYMMTSGESTQCVNEGLKTFSDILKHPSRFSKESSNIKYTFMLKIRWGIIAVFDLLVSLLLLNKISRGILYPFLNKETKKSIKLYETCESCFVKGGGFMHDYNGGMIGIYTTYYQMYHILFAQKFNKPVYIMPNSYGPFKSDISKKIVNKILNKCKLVTSRESISANSDTNGLNRNIELYPDLAFFLENNDDFNAVQYLKDKNIDIENEKYIAITVRPYRFSEYDNPKEKYDKYKKAFISFIIWLNSKNYKPLLVVHTRAENQHENDESCIREICELIEDKSMYKILKDDMLSCRDLKSIYNCCQYVVGTRFHSVIFSMTNKVPAIAVTYGGNKGEGIMRDVDNYKYAIKISELSFETLKNKFQELEKNRDLVIKNIENYLIRADESKKTLINRINEIK